MRRKEVSRLLTSVAEVRASLAAHRDRIGNLLDGRYSPAEPEAAFSYQSYFDHMNQESATVEANLVAAEDEHVRKLVRIVDLRRQSRQLAAGLYDKQISARRVLVGLYGSDRDFELAAMSGRTPETPQILAEQVDQTVKLLRDPEAPEPSRKVAGVDIDLETMAGDLEADLVAFRRLRADYAKARKQADGTRQLTSEAIDAFNRVFPWVARSLESLFRLAGEGDLADRIRTSARRATRRKEGEEEEKSKEPSTDGSTTDETESEPSEAAIDEDEADAESDSTEDEAASAA